MTATLEAGRRHVENGLLHVALAQARLRKGDATGDLTKHMQETMHSVAALFAEHELLRAQAANTLRDALRLAG